MSTTGILSVNTMAEAREGDLPSDWECEPEDEDELECVVKGEPVHGADGALKDGQEGEDHPILQTLISRSSS